MRVGWSRLDPDPDTHHFLPMRYGVSTLQVVRVHPEPVEGRPSVKSLTGLVFAVNLLAQWIPVFAGATL